MKLIAHKTFLTSLFEYHYDLLKRIISRNEHLTYNLKISIKLYSMAYLFELHFMILADEGEELPGNKTLNLPS